MTKTDATEATVLLPCPFCKKPPGTKVGPPALARCITPGCEGTELAAVTLVEWNTRPTPANPDMAKLARSVTVHEYLDGYEFRGDGGDYTPTDNEKELIEDAIEGYLSTLRQSPSPAATTSQEIQEACAKVCDCVVKRAERLMGDPKASRMTLAAIANGAMECAENIRALAAVEPARGVETRCARCGSSGDVFMLCAGCQSPLPAPVTAGVGEGNK